MSPSQYVIAYYFVTYESLISGFASNDSNTVPFANDTVLNIYNKSISGVTYNISVYSRVSGATSYALSVNCTAGIANNCNIYIHRCHFFTMQVYTNQLDKMTAHILIGAHD
jgi:hypothetical protein